MQKIVNRKGVKNLALKLGQIKYKMNPSYIPTRVSGDFLDACEAHLMNYIKSYIENRPAKGKTI